MKQIVGVLSLTCIVGCTTSSPAHLTGSLYDIKNEQRARLYRQCVIDNEDLLFAMPQSAMTINSTCRDWGRQMVR